MEDPAVGTALKAEAAAVPSAAPQARHHMGHPFLEQMGRGSYDYM